MNGAESVNVSTETEKLRISFSMPSLTGSGTVKDFLFRREITEVMSIQLALLF